MTNQQKWTDSLWWGIVITLPVLYFSDHVTTVKVIVTLCLNILLSYFLYYIVFRYIAKNWLKWKEVEPLGSDKVKDGSKK